jgi:hypothetical protein
MSINNHCKIELKWRTVNGRRLTAISAVGRFCRHHPSSSIVEDVFDCGGAPSSFDRGCCRQGLVVSLFPSSLRSSVPLNPDSDDNKDNDEDNDDKDNEDNNNDQF